MNDRGHVCGCLVRHNGRNGSSLFFMGAVTALWEEERFPMMVTEVNVFFMGVIVGPPYVLVDVLTSLGICWWVQSFLEMFHMGTMVLR